jgi:hypothetical protein
VTGGLQIAPHVPAIVLELGILGVKIVVLLCYFRHFGTEPLYFRLKIGLRELRPVRRFGMRCVVLSAMAGLTRHGWMWQAEESLGFESWGSQLYW